MLWKGLALLILVAFYGIYIGKMLEQKKKGIQTDQIAKGKVKDKVYYTEIVMKIATYSVVVVELLSIFQGYSIIGFWGKICGCILGFAGVAVFGTAVWTMRDSWRAGIAQNDQTEMVTGGIYGISRNPAFLGFDLVYAGVVLMFCNPVNLLFSIFAMVMLHLQILQEEKYLPTVFGEAYVGYCGRVSRYLGRKSDN